MSAPCIVAIDPGLTGAVAYYYPHVSDMVAVEDMPVAGKDLDPATLARRIKQMEPTVAVIERVGSMPGQGLSSTFKFGKGYGTVIGVIAALGVPTHFVTPQTWKKHFRLPADKEQARARAIELWPSNGDFSRKKDSGRAEAALIARYFAETQGRAA